MPTDYVGRFAPSPTGPLHVGSVLAAVASFLDARHAGGQWLVRIDDIDRPRQQPGAADQILHTLDTLGLHWDGPVIYQSDHIAAYASHAQDLVRRGHAFPCVCSRRALRDQGPRYPGTCRRNPPPAGQPAALRLRVPAATIAFRDRFLGNQSRQLAREDGDFVIYRRDQIPAYHLANAVDDARHRITHVIRGADLVDETARQIYLHHLLGNPPPVHGHIPIVTGRSGTKLSKQTGAPAVQTDTPQAAARLLYGNFELLGLRPPALLERLAPAEALRWAAEHWPRNRLGSAELSHWHGITAAQN